MYNIINVSTYTLDTSCFINYVLVLMLYVSEPDKDECSTDEGHVCDGECINVPGSYECRCTRPGFQQSYDKKSCVGEIKYNLLWYTIESFISHSSVVYQCQFVDICIIIWFLLHWRTAWPLVVTKARTPKTLDTSSLNYLFAR